MNEEDIQGKSRASKDKVADTVGDSSHGVQSPSDGAKPTHGKPGKVSGHEEAQNFAFVYSTGRCGTSHLARVFGNARSYVCHEEEYAQIYFVMERFLRPIAKSNDQELARRFVRDYKIPFMKHTLRRYSAINYFGTGHQIIFGIVPELLEQLAGRIKLIRLRRDRLQTALSFITAPEYHDPWMPQWKERQVIAGQQCRWALCPTDKIVHLTPTAEAWERLNRFQRYLWAVDEVERQWLGFLEIFSFPFIEVQLEEFNKDQYQRISDFLGIGYREDLIGFRHNATETIPNRNKPPYTEEDLKRFAAEYEDLIASNTSPKTIVTGTGCDRHTCDASQTGKVSAESARQSQIPGAETVSTSLPVQTAGFSEAPVGEIVKKTPPAFNFVANFLDIQRFLNNSENVFLISFPRTGSHWLRSLMELYFDRPTLVRIFYKHDNKDYLLLHDHDLEFKIKRDHIIYLYRDPVDTIFSQINYYRQDQNDPEGIEYWTEQYGRHLSKWLVEEKFTRTKLVTSYEELRSDCVGVVRRLSEYYNVPFDESRAKEAVAQVSKETIRRKTEHHDPQVQNIGSDYEHRRENFRQRYAALVWQMLVRNREQLKSGFERYRTEEHLTRKRNIGE